MHREFSTLLRIHAHSWGELYGIDLSSLEPVVSSCPYPEEGQLSSAIVFDLAKRCPPHLPDEISGALVKLHRGSRFSGYFSLNIAAGGYLNARIEPLFVRKYFSNLHPETEQVVPLFCSQSFVIASERSTAEPLPFMVEWDQLWLRAEKHIESDIRRFAGERASSGVRADRLMLLALLGDGELEAEPYLANLPGRQNVPWYVKRFFADSERALVGWSSGVGDTWDTECPELVNFTLELLSFRAIVLRAHRRVDDGAAVALVAVLGLIRQFYRYFNDPRYRLRSAEDAVCKQLRILTLCTRGAVKTVLRLTNFSELCGSRELIASSRAGAKP